MKPNPLVLAGIFGGIGVVVLIILFFVLRKKGTPNPQPKPKPEPEPIRDLGVPKYGNNGAVSCQTYCTGDYNGLPMYKKAVSATLAETGRTIGVDEVPGDALRPGGDLANFADHVNRLDCMCSNN